jgi:hypothetical protein
MRLPSLALLTVGAHVAAGQIPKPGPASTIPLSAEIIRPVAPLSPASDSLVFLVRRDSAFRRAYITNFNENLQRIVDSVDKNGGSRNSQMWSGIANFLLDSAAQRRVEQEVRASSAPAENVKGVAPNAQALAPVVLASKSAAEAASAATTQSTNAAWAGLAALPLPIAGAAFQGAVVEGVAGYLRTRAQAEVTFSVALKAKKKLCQDKDTVLLPATCRLLAAGADVAPAWGVIKTAVAMDMKRLPQTLVENYVSDERVNMARFARAGLQVTRLVERGEDPVWVIVGLTETYPCSPSCDPADVSGLLHSVGAAARLIGRSSKIVKDSVILAKAVDAFVKELSPIYGAAVRLPDSRTRVATALKDLDASIAEIRRIQGRVKAEPKDVQAYADYLNACLALLRSAPRLVPVKLDSALETQVETATAVINSALATLDRVRDRDYLAAFVEGQNLAAQLGLKTLPAFFSSYGPFLAQLAAAKPEDVEKVLSAAAAPVGSYRAKRGRGAGSFAINAYVGMQGGYEWAAADRKETRGQYGMFAPIGLEASFGFGQKPNMSLGLLLSMVDLGSVLSVRSGDEVVSTDPTKTIEPEAEIGLKQLISPGIFLTLGLSNAAPIALGFGYAVHPDLRSVQSSAAPGTSTTTSTRGFVFFVSVDMPLFRF